MAVLEVFAYCNIKEPIFITIFGNLVSFILVSSSLYSTRHFVAWEERVEGGLGLWPPVRSAQYSTYTRFAPPCVYLTIFFSFLCAFVFLLLIIFYSLIDKVRIQPFFGNFTLTRVDYLVLDTAQVPVLCNWSLYSMVSELELSISDPELSHVGKRSFRLLAVLDNLEVPKHRSKSLCAKKYFKVFCNRLDSFSFLSNFVFIRYLYSSCCTRKTKGFVPNA